MSLVDKLQTAYISHADCLKHGMGLFHPESSQRLVAIENQLLISGLLPQLQHHEAPLASIEQLARVHTQITLKACNLLLLKRS